MLSEIILAEITRGNYSQLVWLWLWASAVDYFRK